MKGLLIKDFALVRQRGKIMLFMLLWGVLMSFMMDGSFVVGWIVMISAISSLSSLNYDEYDNCMPFLMSLPATRRTYAIEKYIFSIICGTIGWAAALVIVLAVGLITRGEMMTGEDFVGMLLFLAAMLTILAFSIPPQIKWGAEKGRIMMLIIFGIIFVGSFVLQRLGGVQTDAPVPEDLPVVGVTLGALALALLLTAVSVMISVRIMEKKEF